MLYVENDGTIRLTRGDTARLTVPITNEMDNRIYEMDPNDTLAFTIKKNVKSDTSLVQKICIGSNTFHIAPTDTEELSFGKYVYDVQLTKTNGDVYTVIEPKTFELLPEVTY